MPTEFRVFRSLAEAEGRFAPSAVTIGNFDGVHLGHQELFRQLRSYDGKPSVLTFDPHPARVLAPQRAPKLLSSLDERLVWMRQAGIEQVLVVPFDLAFSRLTPREFVEMALFRAAGARAVLVGDNFRFGAKQSGVTATLEALGREFGFETGNAGAVKFRGKMVSSTGIRNLIEAGEVSLAGRFLTRPYSLGGEVVPGFGIGSKQTVPTLNLATAAEVLPTTGVYVTRVKDPDTGRDWPSVTNIGMRPTFGGDALTIESFILEGFTEPVPSRIEVAFFRRLRAERKFPDPAALKAQIFKDVRRAQRYWRWLKAPVSGSLLIY